MTQHRRPLGDVGDRTGAAVVAHAAAPACSSSCSTAATSRSQLGYADLGDDVGKEAADN